MTAVLAPGADHTAANALVEDSTSQSSTGWYVIVDEAGDPYSPETVSANPELTPNYPDVKPTVSNGWFVVVDENGAAFSPEAETFNGEFTNLP